MYPQVTFVPETEMQHKAVQQLSQKWPSLYAEPPALAAAKAPTPVPNATPDASPSQPTLEQVRIKLTALSRDGKTAQVKELLGRFGASSLTQLDPQHFTAVLAEAGGL